MKRRYEPFTVLVALWLSIPGALAAQPEARPSAAPSLATSQKNTGWSAKMQSLYHTLESLMTDVSSFERFKTNRHRVEANAKKIADLAHDLNGKRVKSPDTDPSVAIFSALFADNARMAYRAVRSGPSDYGYELVRSVPGYCIACHTRHNSGPDFASLPLEPTTQELSGIERGEFYASTRQYSQALREFRAVIADEEISASRPIVWGNAVKYALAIAVRVKQDPAVARGIVESARSSRYAPLFMKEDASHWLESIDDWSKEPPHTAVTEEGLYAEAVRLLGQAHEAQKYPIDHAADVLYLRASAAVHDLLELAPGGRHSGEGYLMAGICYEVLSSFHVGEVQDIYYEACVRSNAHTRLAAACYHRYQESIFFGYTGSGGTHLPQDEKDKLNLLENLSAPAAAPGNSQN